MKYYYDKGANKESVNKVYHKIVDIKFNRYEKENR